MINDETKLESHNLIGEQTSPSTQDISEDSGKKFAIISIIVVVAT